MSEVAVASRKVMPKLSVGSIALVVGSSVIGNTIEFYDFLIYGFASAFVFNKLFFPTIDPLSGVMASFATFGVGFAFRPLGALFFGHLGDTVGRKATLVLTMLAMGISTVAIGFLPGYAQIGVMAPVLLVTLRCIQGFALGGEWGGAITMVVEHAPPHRRGMLGALPQTAGFLGNILGAGSFALLGYLSEPELLSWGWRVPFIASALLVGIGFFIRFKLDETHAFNMAKKDDKIGKELPLVEAIRTGWRRILLCMLLRFGENGPFYLVSIFAVSYATRNLGVPRETILNVLMIASAFTIVSYAFWGWLVDRIGRRAIFLWGSVFVAAVAFPFFMLLDSGNTWLILLGYFLMLNCGQNAVSGAQPAFYTELFPAHIRYTGVSMGSAFGAIVAGGFLPLIATELGNLGYGWYPVAGYVAITALIAAIAAFFGPDTKGTDI